MQPHAPFDQEAVGRPAPRRPVGNAPFGLRAAVVALGVLVLAGLVGLVLVHVQPGLFSGLRSGASTTSSSSPPTRSTTSTTVPSGSSSSGGASPVITSLQPASGAAGQTVTIIGSGLFSADGNVAVTFGAAAAGVRCPTESKCLVTVPAGKAGSSVSVRLTTQSGQSNVVTFRYR